MTRNHGSVKSDNVVLSHNGKIMFHPHLVRQSFQTLCCKTLRSYYCIILYVYICTKDDEVYNFHFVANLWQK